MHCDERRHNTHTEENSVAEFESFTRSISEEHLLVREITHRIKNEYTSAINFVSLAAARSDNAEVKVALTNVMDQLYNYARVHRALEMPSHDISIDASEYMRTLCHSISKSKLNQRGIELLFVDSPVQLSSDRCWKLGMIASELITNAERHAFVGNGGTVRVELLSRGALVECRITDNGSAREPVKPGHGTEIVRALAKGLDGEFVQSFGPGDTTSILVFPLRISRRLRRSSENNAAVA
jgi:two-component sensor histidine kinase